MAFLNILKNKKRLYQKYYEKTGILITDDPVNPNPSIIDDRMEELHNLSFDNPREAIPILEKLVFNYPEVPAIKNYLYNCYIGTDQKKRAEKILDQTIKEHPDYIFGFANKIINANDKKEAEKYAHLLGHPRSIKTIQPEAEKYHISAFTTYQTAAAIYETYNGEHESAVKRLESLIDIGVEKNILNELARRLAEARMDNMFGMFSEKKERDRSVVGKIKVKYEPAENPPNLHHKELENFYKYPVAEFPKNKIDKIIGLPKETLIPDLESIIEDSIRRWDHFKQTDYKESTHEFQVHALYFLGALKSEKSLPKVLDLLRMGLEFSDYWFADYAENYFYPVLYDLGQNQLDILKNHALERGIDGYNRLHVAKVVAQVALQQPERRSECVQWFKEVYEHHLKHENDDQLIDTDFIGLSVGNVTDFRGTELFPLVEKMWDKGWISEMLQGDIYEIKEEINEPLHEYEIEPLPKNIFEYYSGEYINRKADPPEKIRLTHEKIEKGLNNKAEKLILDQHKKLFTHALSNMDDDNYDNGYEDDYYHEPIEQVKRETPKVGRNDPCPCGSGRKYKKCCMKK